MNVNAAQPRSTPGRRHIDRNRWVSIRPIERSDASALSDFYAGLSPESRYRRFLSYGQRTAAEIQRRFASGGAEGFVGILDAPGPHDGAVVAHASVHSLADGTAEIAFAVADDFQGRGIGTALMEAVVHYARLTGLRCLTANLMADNVRMRRLLHGTGCEIVGDRVDHGVEEMALDLAAG